VFSKLSKNERKILSDIYNRIKNKCMAVAVNIIKDTALAEDVVHNAFAGLLKHKDTFFSLESYQQEVYIVVSVRNKAIDILRSKSNKEIQLYDNSNALVADIDFFDVEKHHESNEGYSQLVAMIESLPEIYQTVFELRYMDGFSNEEIAQILGIKKSTVAKQFERARKMLQQKVGGGEHSG